MQYGGRGAGPTRCPHVQLLDQMGPGALQALDDGDRTDVALQKTESDHRGLPQQDGDDLQTRLRLPKLPELQTEGQSAMCLGWSGYPALRC